MRWIATAHYFRDYSNFVAIHNFSCNKNITNFKLVLLTLHLKAVIIFGAKNGNVLI